eukprot:163648-Pleurochrysis_carterae.AAC.3
MNWLYTHKAKGSTGGMGWSTYELSTSTYMQSVTQYTMDYTVQPQYCTLQPTRQAVAFSSSNCEPTYQLINYSLDRVGLVMLATASQQTAQTRIQKFIAGLTQWCVYKPAYSPPIQQDSKTLPKRCRIPSLGLN